MKTHNAKPFSTFDRNNDLQPKYNCAEKYKGAWWYTYTASI